MSDVVIALDVGGTGIKCALVDGQGLVVHSERHRTDRERGADAVVATILEITAGLAETAKDEGHSPLAVGIVVPGIVDEEDGVAVWSANLGFRDVPLKKLVEQRLGLPTALGHDVRAGGLAEARLGAGRGSRHVLFVAIGTGIAAASIVDGTLFTGAHGAAGEIGHIVVRPGGPECGCGQRGCLEIIASAAAVGRRYAERADQGGARAAGAGSGGQQNQGGAGSGGQQNQGGAGSGGQPNQGGSGAQPDRPAFAEEVAALAAAGDPIAGAVWQETIDALADGLLIGIALFDPEVVVVGGGLAEASDALLDPLRSGVHKRVTFHREPVLRPAALGDEAGCLGAALLALDAIGGAG